MRADQTLLIGCGLGAASVAVLAGNLMFFVVDWPMAIFLSVGLILAAGFMLWRAVRRPPALKTMLAPLAAVLDTALGARCVTDGSGRVILANAAATEWLAGSMPLDRLASLAALEYDGDEAVVRLRQAIEAGMSDHVEVPLRGNMPEPDWYKVSVRRLDLAGGLTLWSLEDITAIKAINDVLGQERQDLADFLDFMPVGVYSVDVDGTFRYLNQRFAQWLGAEPEDLIGTTLDLVLIAAERPDVDGEWQGSLRFRPTAGEPFDGLVIQSTYDDAGVTRTRTLVLRDAMAAETDGAGGGTRFRDLFDSAPVAIAIADPDGSISDCNHAFAALMEQDRELALGSALTDFLVEDDRRSLKSELDKVLAGRASNAQVDVRLSAGRANQASVFLGPLAGAVAAAVGEVEGAVIHVIDTTEQKNLEVQFAQAQKMQAMGQLAGGVAHDFNNLLTAMIGFCDLLLQRHGAGDPSFADIMQIKQNANRAANLVRQLLAFSRKQPLQSKELHVTDQLTELSHLLTRLIGESIEFKLVHGRDLGLVRVDPGQFDQMIINLAVNARDAMPGGGTLTIATDTETFDEPTQLGAEQVPPGRYVTIAVADTGKGISREDIGRIFEPFFSTKKETPGAGTGLGLATVYGVVRQTGGFILVDSALGQGARFTIYLPRIAPEVEAADSDSPAEISMKARDLSDEEAEALAGRLGGDLAGAGAADTSGSGTVLLVEDEDAVRVFAARALKNKGYTVLEARTGEQAMDILHGRPEVDLMVTDMMMPGMDGGTLARFVRMERPEVRILLISGYSEEVARGDVVDSPDIHFLPKPFSLGQLAAKVKDIMKLPPPM